MNELKYTEILTKNRELGKSLTGPVYQIAVLSNIVVNQLSDILEFELRRQGINAKVVFGEYNNIVQDSSRFKDSNAVILFWEAANLTEGLQSQAESMDASSLSALIEHTQNEIELVLNNLQHVPLVLFNTFSSLLFTANELKDGKFSLLSKKLKSNMADRIASHQLPIDLDKIIAKVGLGASTDFRQYQSSKALYSIEFLKTYVDTVTPAFRAVTGMGRKVLVLDCDNTLWGGILGEDGENGIQIGDGTRSGKVFREIQHILRGFLKQGILLALCSKNNPEDVNHILSGHSDMVLTDSDIVAKKVNWNDKVTNLRELANELNLGLESFVFIDDSQFEIGLVEKELPQVKCIKVPEVLSNYPEVLRSLEREFFSFNRTAEDADKTKMYQQEWKRNSESTKFTSTEDYLRSLNLQINVQWNEAVLTPRAAQLTQKTNQFNFTTKRYTEGDIQRMINDKNYLVASFSVNDKYGDYGITGLLISKLNGSMANIDTFLMSCRVIGRNIEIVFFDYVIEKLKSVGIKDIESEYIPTAKNQQVATFYSSRGLNADPEKGKKFVYRINLKDYKFSDINYIGIAHNG